MRARHRRPSPRAAEVGGGDDEEVDGQQGDDPDDRRGEVGAEQAGEPTVGTTVVCVAHLPAVACRRRQVEQHGRHAAVGPPSSPKPSLEKIELMCFSTACSLIEQRGGHGGVVLPGRHLVEDLALACRQRGERRDSAWRSWPRTSESMTSSAIDRPAVGDRGDGIDEVADVVGAILQHVAPPARALTQQQESELRLADTARGRARRHGGGPAQRGRRPHPLVRARRRHADVGQHDVGPVRVDGGDQLVERSALASTSTRPEALSSRLSPSRRNGLSSASTTRTGRSRPSTVLASVLRPGSPRALDRRRRRR